METSAFAQRLAGNEQTKRDRALKKLKKFIAARAAKPGGFSQEELLQLWKGLHYCMWMQDKPLLQEELSGKLCGLLKAFPDADSALAFAAAFFTTQAREWARLDQWRMDKFMMLIRDFLHATLEVVQRNRWDERLLETVSAMIGEVMDAAKEDYPDGFRLHLADIYLEELEKVGASELTGEQINVLLDPFVQYIVKSKRDTIANRIISTVFMSILGNAKRGAECGTLKFDFSGLRKIFFDAGRQKNVLPKIRKKMYKLVKRFSRRCGEESPLEGGPLQLPVQGKRKSIVDNQEEPKKKKRKAEGKQPSSRTEADHTEKEPEKKTQKKARSEGIDHWTPGSTTEVTHRVQPQTAPAQQKADKLQNLKKATPSSTPRRVSFDLVANSSRDVKAFMDNIQKSPYLPTCSPVHGILKESPGSSSTPAFRKPSHPVQGTTPKGSPGFDRGQTPSPSQHRKNTVLNRKSKVALHKNWKKKGKLAFSCNGDKLSKFASIKKGKVVKKPKHR